MHHVPRSPPPLSFSLWSSKAVELSPDTSEFWLNRGLAYESIADTLFVAKPADATQVRQLKVTFTRLNSPNQCIRAT